MKSNYVIAPSAKQTRKSLFQGGHGTLPRAGTGAPCKAVRLPQPFLPVQLKLRGDRETLRSLRAAEMTAWEAVPPSTRPQPAAPRFGGKRLPQGERDGWASGEVWMMLVLTACAAAALAIGSTDLSAFLSGWFRFADNIQKLLG
jgi:hypothetical protein